MSAILLQKLEQMIQLEEAFLPKFAKGTPQHSLLRNRIRALQTAQSLISGQREPSREELEFALPRIESIIHKTSKARDKYESGSRNYKRFDPTVQAMEQVRSIILLALEAQQCGLQK